MRKLSRQLDRCRALCTPRRCAADVEGVTGGVGDRKGWKKPPPPNSVNAGSHFAINFFSEAPGARSAAGERRGECTDRRSERAWRGGGGVESEIR